jgi:hypothetical protein
MIWRVNMTDNVEVTQALREECEAEWDHLLNKTFSRHMAVEHLAQFVLSHRLAATASNAAMVDEIRALVASLYCAAGCNCCRDDAGWFAASEALGKLLGAPNYSDGSGVDWYSVRDAARAKASEVQP